jgi:CHASE2 domain-containing sensor protein
MALDAMLASAFPAQSDRTVLVVITQDDYDSIFQGRSPLSPEGLAQVLESVAAAKPRLIVVDIDTAAGDFRSWADRPSLKGIVWARDAEVTGESIELGPVLGADNPPGVRWGVAVLPADRDGVIRRYRRTFVAAGGGRRAFGVPSLAAAAVDALCSDGHDEACQNRTPVGRDHDDLRIMRFAGSRTRYPRLTASAILEAAPQAWWADASPLRDRIAIVGGTYRAARDEYVTPLGAMDGVQLVAQAVEAELDGHVKPVNHTVMMTVELLAGVFFVFLNYRFPPGGLASALLNATAVAALAVVSSFLVFATFSSWATFVPVGLAIRLHRVYERFAEHRQTRRELDEYRRLYGDLPKSGR